ncbi:MAG: hypothetical protein AAF683_00295 [Pseudomonadota bacterium]
MCEGSQPAEPKSCAQLQIEYAMLIKEQMRKQGVSVRCLVAEGILKKSHRTGFFKRIEEGSLFQGEITKITKRLNIDPIRAAITVNCFDGAESYEDPSCKTAAALAKTIGVELREEMAAIDGNFEGLHEGQCKGLARRTVNEIARNHERVEAERDAIAEVGRAYG